MPALSAADLTAAPKLIRWLAVSQWLWLARAASGRGRDPVTLAIAALLVVWWIVLTRSWPSDSSPASISAVRYSVIFVANLAALTVSVIGEQTVLRRGPRVRAADVRAGRSRDGVAAEGVPTRDIAEDINKGHYFETPAAS